MAVESLGRMVIYIGVVMIMVGGFFILVAKVPWFGRLPGDIVWRREGITIFIPITTMILLSVALTLLLNIIWRR